MFHRILLSYRGVILKTKSLLVSLLALTSNLRSAGEETALQNEIYRLSHLLTDLLNTKSLAEKVTRLDEIPEVQSYFSKPSPICTFIAGLSEDCEYVIKATFAIGQGGRIFDIPISIPDPIPHYRRLLDELLAIDHFYKDLGGIVGYQCLVLSLLAHPEFEVEETIFQPPEGIDLSDERDPRVRHAIIEGIRNQKETAEFYPVGGAADRLQLRDDKTGKGLPAACLIFQGKHLLERVVHDLQAREYLYYKFFGEQILTPLALMTSKVNHNHDYIQEICLKNRWFGRPRDSFKFFTQPSIPVFNRQGQWCLQKPMKLLLRPGGHGVIWKLAEDKGIFDWLHSLKCKKALIRQINNPMAAVDYSLAAFLGIGHEENKAFGFASCERRVNAHEGMNVLKIIESPEGRRVVLTNVEYCDFEKFGIEDKPKDTLSQYSLFPSNTNILFVDLVAVREAAHNLPFPGLLMNFRKGSHYDPLKGSKKEEIARLETTMQNIADAFDLPLEETTLQDLPTYVTFNKRRKTISTTKRKIASNGQLLETPEGCFYDFMQNAQELLDRYCGIELTSVENESAFLRKGPSFLMSYHPALGPLYSIIKQKIQGGEIQSGSELQLEIADLDMKNLSLDGSLLIVADAIMGHTSEQGQLVYSNQTGQCILKNVRIENKGIDWNTEDHLFWKHDIKRRESLTILLHGHSRFEAQNVTFKGDHIIEVPEGSHMIVSQVREELQFETCPLEENKPFWSYQIDSDEAVVLSRIDNKKKSDSACTTRLE